MELITSNLFNTTTMATVSDGSLTVENLLERQRLLQFVTESFNNDLTTASITIDFGSTQTVSRIAIVDTNLKSFTIYSDGATASTITLTSGPTTTSDWSTNSETSMYLQFATIQAQSFTIDMKSTQLANSNKAIGYLHFADVKTNFETRVPAAADYKPSYSPEEIVHKLSDGAVRQQQIQVNYEAKVKLKYISETLRNTLFSIWRSNDEFAFVPFGTATSWDAVIHNVAWVGDFDFFRYADNAPNVGFSGSMNLKEIS